MTPSEAVLARAEDLAERVLPARTPKKRMLVIVNPYASTVSDRLKSLVVYALRGRYEVEAVDTQAQGHATELCREAAHEGFDVVVAFGGDGTVNEAANGLLGSETPLTCLPGGSTNVFCRLLGLPNDVVDATEHLLRMADDFHPRRVDTGVVELSGGTAGGDGTLRRHFTFASGIGLDASVVERVDRHPYRKARFGEWYFTSAALATFTSRYLVRPPRVRVDVGGESVEGVTVIVQNGDPFTFFSKRPIRICTGVTLESGTLSLGVLKRGTPLDIPTVLARVFTARAEIVQRHRHIVGFDGLTEARVDALTETFPIQVDGDYLGDFTGARYSAAPSSLAVVS